MTNLLSVQHLSYKLGQKTILADFNLDLRAGELLILTGPNGSGKSTLAELIMGLKQPSSGDILFLNQSILALNVTERARLGIALAFQLPVAIRGLKVKDVVANPKTLAQVGLSEDYLERQLDTTLSGGERKRIEIASVLSRQAQLYIFDEPEAGIDLWSFDRLVKIFQKLQKAQPTASILLISHQERLFKIATRVVNLADVSAESSYDSHS